jgi:four helix bundle protein
VGVEVGVERLDVWLLPGTWHCTSVARWRPGQGAWGRHRRCVVEQKALYLHERLEAYQLAVKFYRTIKVIRSALPRGLGPIGDQISRAAASICLNLAEGAESRFRDVKRRHFAIALGSATECAAALDLLEIEQAADQAQLAAARAVLKGATLRILGLTR